MARTHPTADHEKRWVALTSLWAAVFITVFKVVVGLLTGSMGILAEAAHSALDLAAALMTFLAIRMASKPADPQHLYGHGKIENLSALFETVLLLVTCAWIVWEATHRLISGTAPITVNAWSFAVMATSIVVDYSRSRALSRAATKHSSQALAADALHFETDIWSSLAVIVGLVCVKVSEWYPSLKELHHADAIAALIVVVIVLWVIIKMGMATIQALLDSAPAGMQDEIRKTVENLPGVTDCHHIRLRYSGPQVFVDVHVRMDGEQTLTQAHELTKQIEHTIQKLIPRADVTVHPEPAKKTASSSERMKNEPPSIPRTGCNKQP